MCAHYESVHDRARLQAHFGVDLPDESARRDVWPGDPSTFIRRHPQADVGDDAVPAREALLGSFGLIPHWATDTKIARHTYNARSESVAEKPSFRDAWRKAQHCIIPVESFFEPDWRSGKAVPTRIGHARGEPLGAAGLWSAWRDPQGTILHSFTMLTLNADHHPLMNQFHKPTDEKRMIVILPPERYDDWLQSSAKDSGEFLQAWPAEQMAVGQISGG
ncbi:MAG: SOS response-associated peptidase [Limnohabitans sp.]